MASSSPSRITRAEAEALEIAPWDKIAPSRAADLDRDRDPSYKYVLSPSVRSLLGKRPRFVLDAGCGVGRLTKQLAGGAQTVVGIDPSSISARLAREHLSSHKNVKIHDLTIEQYSRLGYTGHDYCVALMVLQDVVDLESFLKAAYAVLEPGGQLIAAITNPSYWPTYWGYDSAPWFDAEKEIFIKSEFRTSLVSSGVSTLHVHRPKSMYLSTLERTGFTQIDSWEPIMPPMAQRRTGVKWQGPHFWIFRAQTVSS